MLAELAGERLEQLPEGSAVVEFGHVYSIDIADSSEGERVAPYRTSGAVPRALSNNRG